MFRLCQKELGVRTIEQSDVLEDKASVRPKSTVHFEVSPSLLVKQRKLGLPVQWLGMASS